MAAAQNIISGTRIEAGCTDGWIELWRTASGVYILSMEADSNPENRWVHPFNQAMHKAFDAIEHHLECVPDGPAALVTISKSDKFFSNGIDPTGSYSKQIGMSALSDPEKLEFHSHILPMPGFIRPLQLPIPTFCAVNGHAFGAGFMFALGHDYRLQRKDRGFMCAPEVQVGVGIPPPEMELFKHCMPVNAYYETTLGAKRWGAQEAHATGIVHKTCTEQDLWSDALKMAEQHSKLASGLQGRRLYGSIKNQAKGRIARDVMKWCFPNGALPKILSDSAEATLMVQKAYPYLMQHAKDAARPLPPFEMIMPQMKAKL